MRSTASWIPVAFSSIRSASVADPLDAPLGVEVGVGCQGRTETRPRGGAKYCQHGRGGELVRGRRDSAWAGGGRKRREGLARPEFPARNNSRSKIGLFIEYLIGTGIAAPRPTPACEEPGRYLARFLVWLRRYRGIGEPTIQSYHKAMRVLLPHLGDDPGRYSATPIRNTVRCRLETASRELVRRETSALRLYLRFLVLDGLCRPRLVGAVPTIPRHRFSTLPRHLPRDDIERIIAKLGEG